uniref:Uncharacterized protein n=1 Tax=Tanacetum cinerariifolium TaxID=118510 RepID=A0A6L2NEZ3_TANCI|nr:hypothetical protein [Tanacetum cinerariifolium]
MIGTSSSSSISKTTKKVDWKDELIKTNIFSQTLRGYLIDWSANWILILVSFSLEIPNRKKRECVIRLMIAPKSTRAFFPVNGPTRHGSVKLHGSSLPRVQHLLVLVELGKEGRRSWGIYTPHFSTSSGNLNWGYRLGFHGIRVKKFGVDKKARVIRFRIGRKNGLRNTKMMIWFWKPAELEREHSRKGLMGVNGLAPSLVKDDASSSNRNYLQLLPIIAERVHQEKVQQDKLKAIKACLNFKEALQYSESRAPRRRRNLKERLRSRRACSISESPKPRHGHSESPRKRGPERRKVFKRLKKGVFHKLRYKGKGTPVYSNNSKHRSYHSNRKDTESCYQSSRSRETEFVSRKRHDKRTSLQRTKALSESEGSTGGH